MKIVYLLTTIKALRSCWSDRLQVHLEIKGSTNNIKIIYDFDWYYEISVYMNIYQKRCGRVSLTASKST